MIASSPPIGFVDGTFQIDAAFIAGKFDMPVEEARALMRRGLFRSTVEKGEGEDAGRWRLTMRCGNRVWQGIVSEDGTVRHESVGLAGGRGAQSASPLSPGPGRRGRTG